MCIRIRQALLEDVDHVSSILQEVAEWLRASQMAMWRGAELTVERITADVAEGLFFVAEHEGKPAGTIKFQLEDPLFWPDLPTGESAFVHRFAVRRCFAGGGVSTALLQWAVQRAQGLGKEFLRLDCEASRTKLRVVYERFGFQYHSERQVGPYYVSRYEYRLR